MEKNSVRKFVLNDALSENEFLMNIEKGEDFKPLKIFISYGHTEAVICNLICDCLARRGHTVWYDANDILPGNDWRASIIDGIVGCDTFVAGLSKHYIRDNSVCLDELSIAIGVKKGNVKTILLEDEKDVCVPGSVSNIQWLDLHDWNEKMLDMELFKGWFKEKMRELIQTLEAKPDRDFNGQIANLKNYLHPNYSLSKQAYLLEKQYTDREWLSDKINNWLDERSTEKLCVVYGAPGSGKSIFAANYMHYNARVAASIFCEAGRPQFNNSNNIIRVLAYQLACRLPEYRVMLNYLVNEKTIYQMNESEMFDYLIADPLNRSYIGGHGSMCILIDGLDECGDSESNILAEVLKLYSERLPYWLKILVFSRKESSVIASFEGSDVIILEEHNKENQEDITRYVLGKIKKVALQDKFDDSIVKTIVEKSQGVFLYADLVTEALVTEQISVLELDQIPPGLNSILYHWFTRIFRSNSEFEEEYADVLSVLLSSKESVPKEEICAAFRWKNRKLAAFMRRFNVFLKETKNVFGKDTIEFSHIYIKEWLCSKNAGKFQCSSDDGRYVLAQYYLKTYSENGCDGLSEYGVMNIKDCFRSAGIATSIIEKDSDLFWKIMHLGFHCDEDMNERDALLCFQTAKELLGSNQDEKACMNKISALHMCGESYKKTGDFQNAEISFGEELQLMQAEYSKSGQESLRNMLLTYRGYANFLSFTGKYAEACRIYEDAFALIEQNEGECYDKELVNASYNVYSEAAINYRELRLLEKSIHYFEKAIKLLEKVQEPSAIDKTNILTQRVNICIIEEDLGKWEGHLPIYFDYLVTGQEKESLMIQGYANTYIGGEYQRLGNLEKAKIYFIEANRCFTELSEKSEDLSWKQELFLSLSRLAAVDYLLTGNNELYEKAIPMGEYFIKTGFLPFSINGLLIIYRDYVFGEKKFDHISDVIKNIIVISERFNQGESSRIKETLKSVQFMAMECIDTINADKRTRILLCKYALQSMSRAVNEIYDQDFLKTSEANIWFCIECYGYLQDLEMDSDLSGVLNDLCIQLEQEINLFQNASGECDDEVVVPAYIELGRIYEKCTEYDKAFEAFLKAVTCQRVSMKTDWYSYRRVYFSLNDCGRMKVAMGKPKEAVAFFENAVECINEMYAQGIDGDNDDRDNYKMIQETIKQIASLE